jgi:hypothetical protein
MGYDEPALKALLECFVKVHLQQSIKYIATIGPYS